MIAWTGVLKPWTALSSAGRWAIYIGLLVGSYLMVVYTQLLNEHMARADLVRLGQRSAAYLPAAGAVVLKQPAQSRRREKSDPASSSR